MPSPHLSLGLLDLIRRAHLAEIMSAPDAVRSASGRYEFAFAPAFFGSVAIAFSVSKAAAVGLAGSA